MVIVSFHTTADAFGFEAAAKRCGLHGRLGTIPRTISAGCGFAWFAEGAQTEDLLQFIEQQGLEYEGVHER